MHQISPINPLELNHINWHIHTVEYGSKGNKNIKFLATLNLAELDTLLTNQTIAFDLENCLYLDLQNLDPISLYCHVADELVEL